MIRFILLFLLVAFSATFGITHNWWLAVVIVVIILLILTGKEGRREPKPSCYADWPHYHPQTAAERCCGDCPVSHECFEDTPYNPRRPLPPPPRPVGDYPPPARPTR